MIPGLFPLESFPGPLGDRGFQLVEPAIKKMVRAFNDLHCYRRLDFGGQFLKASNVTVLIILAVHEQDRLVVPCQKTEIVFIYGRADADQSYRPSVVDSYFHSHAGAERKAANSSLFIGIMRGEIIQPGTGIIAFSVPFIMRSGALAYAAKIDSQRN